MTDYSPTGRPKRDTIGMGTEYEDPPFMVPIREQMDREHLAEAAGTTLTLGQLIEQLEALPAELTISFVGCGLDGQVPTEFTSWRGVYADLGLVPGYPTDSTAVPTVADFLRLCETADGAVLEGWKGGNFPMDRWTPVFVDVEGESTSDRGISHVAVDLVGDVRVGRIFMHRIPA